MRGEGIVGGINMFTGIVQAIGEVESLQPWQGDARLTVRTDAVFLSSVALGDSIATQGVCLTVVWRDERRYRADVSGETLAQTTLGRLNTGSTVNLERALTLATPLGGHLVSGHVDGVGIIEARWQDARSIRFRIRAPAPLARYIAAKGSITVDGISLTVNDVAGQDFELNLVPHTLAVTTAGTWLPGVEVNLEVDLLARYLERLLRAGASVEWQQGVTPAQLAGLGRLD